MSHRRTRRGFTFHEHLDSTGLIHMNGRVYDPLIGRFLSADPYVPDPFSTQDFNRYSYVGNNNPLSYIDPSGCVFHVMPGQDFTACRAGISRMPGQRFMMLG